MLKDELQCVNRSVNCVERRFACLNGKCLMDSLVCDMKNDCGDGSDELRSMCGE